MQPFFNYPVTFLDLLLGKVICRIGLAQDKDMFVPVISFQCFGDLRLGFFTSNSERNENTAATSMKSRRSVKYQITSFSGYFWLHCS